MNGKKAKALRKLNPQGKAKHGPAADERARPSEAWTGMIDDGGLGETADVMYKDMHNLVTAILLRDQQDPDAVIQKALAGLEKQHMQPGSKGWQGLLRTLGIPDDPAMARTQIDFTVGDAWMMVRSIYVTSVLDALALLPPPKVRGP